MTLLLHLNPMTYIVIYVVGAFVFFSLQPLLYLLSRDRKSLVVQKFATSDTIALVIIASFWPVLFPVLLAAHFRVFLIRKLVKGVEELKL